MVSIIVRINEQCSWNLPLAKHQNTYASFQLETNPTQWIILQNLSRQATMLVKVSTQYHSIYLGKEEYGRYV
jgi:hypothetical protein